MTSMYFRVLFLVAILPVALTVLCFAEDLPRIAANNNRTPAGELTGGVLTIKLELRQGRWQPENENGGALTVYAFGEAGRTLQNPGPLIRVPQGTDVHAI